MSHGANSAYKVDFCKQIVKTSSKAVKMGYQNPDFFHIGEEQILKERLLRLSENQLSNLDNWKFEV